MNATVSRYGFLLVCLFLFVTQHSGTLRRVLVRPVMNPLLVAEPSLTRVAALIGRNAQWNGAEARAC